MPLISQQYRHKFHYIDNNGYQHDLFTDDGSLIFKNVTVKKESFLPDTTYPDYPYRALVNLSGVTEEMMPYCAFSLGDIQEGILCPVQESLNAGLYLYASTVPDHDITIPCIKFWRF